MLVPTSGDLGQLQAGATAWHPGGGTVDSGYKVPSAPAAAVLHSTAKRASPVSVVLRMRGAARDSHVVD